MDFCSTECTHKPEELRIFVDLSKFSFKVVQLHNGNIHTSKPTAHSVHMKKPYANMNFLLRALSYLKYGCKICRDLKVIGFLLGLQSGYIMLCCFLCEWDSRAQDKHYKIMDWPLRETSFPGENISVIDRTLTKIKLSYRQNT